jgi:hypothetical protein
LTPSPNVPVGHATLHVDALQTGSVSGREEAGQTFPHAPQLFRLLVMSMQLVVPPAVHGLLAEPSRAPQIPLASPVVAVEQAWHVRLHALWQQTPSLQEPLLHCVFVEH